MSFIHINQKGFMNIPITVFVVILAGMAGYLVVNNLLITTPTPPILEQPTPTSTPPIIEQPTPSPVPSPTPTPPILEQPTPSPMPITPKMGDVEEIQALLNKEEWVLVIVMLKGNEFTDPNFIGDDAKKNAEAQRIQSAVLATLTTDDFQVYSRFQSITGFAGKISKSGMEKLLNDQRVISISLDKLSEPT